MIQSSHLSDAEKYTPLQQIFMNQMNNHLGLCCGIPEHILKRTPISKGTPLGNRKLLLLKDLL